MVPRSRREGRRRSDRLDVHSIEQPSKIWKGLQNVHDKNNDFAASIFAKYGS